MKKILLGLFVLGTLGMAQQNYEVYIKSGVKISQSEVDRDSKEIENLVNKEIIERYNREGKKIIVEKATELYKKTIDWCSDAGFGYLEHDSYRKPSSIRMREYHYYQKTYL